MTDNRSTAESTDGVTSVKASAILPSASVWLLCWLKESCQPDKSTAFITYGFLKTSIISGWQRLVPQDELKLTCLKIHVIFVMKCKLCRKDWGMFLLVKSVDVFGTISLEASSALGRWPMFWSGCCGDHQLLSLLFFSLGNSPDKFSSHSSLHQLIQGFTSYNFMTLQYTKETRKATVMVRHNKLCWAKLLSTNGLRVVL